MTAIKTNSAIQNLVSKIFDKAAEKLDLPSKLPTKTATAEEKANDSYVEYGMKGDSYTFSAKDNYENSWTGSKSGSKEVDINPETQKKLEKGADMLGSLQKGLEALGIKPELTKNFEAAWEKKAEANSSGKTQGKYGEAEYEANATAEAVAGAAGQMTLNMNGLDAEFAAKIGLEATAQVSGKASTTLNVGGVSVPVSAEGNMKATAKLTAEAEGSVKVTREPLSAVIKGSVGMSAVAKLEGGIKASAGPFSIKADGYVSAGAEAQAAGQIGFENGKLKISGSIGAALGIGVGGSVDIEVDFKQLGDMAKEMAGKAVDSLLEKTGLKDTVNQMLETAQDVKAAVGKVVDAAKEVKETVDKAASFVKGLFGFGK